MSTIQTPELLRAEGMCVSYAGRPAVHQLDLTLYAGQALALVGESGCGKSTTAMALMGLLPEGARVSGQVHLKGQELLSLTARQWADVRGEQIGMIFQEPMTSLNPVYRAGSQVMECLLRHQPQSELSARNKVLELFDKVQLTDPQRVFAAWPHELSGGQRQRVMIAMAIACEPALLIADEPTTALDASVQLQVLRLLRSLSHELSMGLLLISHDLPVVSRWADDVVVMHHGEQMEKIAAARLFSHASHPYSQGLLGASLKLGDDLHYRQATLPEIEVSHDVQQNLHHFTLRRPQLIRPTEVASKNVLQVRDLAAGYGRYQPHVIQGINLDIQTGATLGLLGESGSGKSTLCKVLIGLVTPSHGRIELAGREVGSLTPGQRLDFAAQHLQMIFQDPYSSLNPRQSVGTLLERTLKVHGVGSRKQRRLSILRMLDAVGLPASSTERYPHEFSGGQRQRIAIARALISEPDLVICDEPVSALDVSVRAQILNLLIELKHELGLSYLFISHDLAVVKYMADDVVVMQQGRIVEHGAAASLWQSPQTAYTRQLIEASQ